MILLVLVLAGCGNSSDPSGVPGSGAESTADGYVDWPQFGRVPARTHYLPESKRALDPPLRQAWSINTHALVEFPPAIHDGIAYVINKYGNGKAVRLRDRKVLWELKVRPSNKGKPNFLTAPVYYNGAVYGAFVDGHVAAGDAANGKKLWVRKLNAHLESSPLAVDGRLYLGTDTTNLVALDAKSGKTDWTFNSPAAIKASPSYDKGQVFAADYQSSMYALDAQTGKVDWRTNTSKAPPFGRGGFYSSRPSPSVASTPPATTAPSSPSTRRPARSTGPSRPVKRSTARPPSPGSPERRRRSTSALKTAASSPSTRAPASRAGNTTSAARSRAPLR